MSIEVLGPALDWSDQPREIAYSIGVARISTKLGTLAIYKNASCYYVTIGNLFGSETVQVPDAEHALTLVGMLYEDRRVPGIVLPSWAKRMERS